MHALKLFVLVELSLLLKGYTQCIILLSQCSQCSCNDVFLATDSGECVFLLLDLTAVFDAVDHEILLCSLETGWASEGQHWSSFRSWLKKLKQGVGLI